MKRYRDLNTYLKELYGERVQKITLDSGLTCPNRDGTISSQGCIFCDARGSGTGAMIHRSQSLDIQIIRAKEFLKKRYKARKFIAYFQSFTNTYGPINVLREIYDRAMAHPDMVGLSVATRPDCLGRDKLDLLCSYQDKGLVWLELGLQSAHDATLKTINRGHDVACFEQAVSLAASRGLSVCAHIILGLPGETRKMMLETARFLAGQPIKGVKIHLLYVVRGTPLEELFLKGDVVCLAREEYVDLVIDFLDLLPPEMIIHRLTGDPPRSELIAPGWALDKMKNLQMIEARMRERKTWQGAGYQKNTGSDGTTSDRI